MSGSPAKGRIPVTCLLGSSRKAKERLLGRLDASGLRVCVLSRDHLDLAPGMHLLSAPEAVAECSLGCPCCRVRLDLYLSLHREVSRRYPPDRVVIVASESTDPAPMLATILCDHQLYSRLALGPVITVVDAAQAAVRLATDQTLAPDLVAQHLSVADVIVVVDSGSVTDVARSTVFAALKELNPFARLEVDMPGQPAHPFEVTNPFSLDTVARRLDGLAPAPMQCRGGVLIELVGEGDSDALRDWAQEMFSGPARNLLRFQAVCPVRGRSRRWACSGVRSFYIAGEVAPADESGDRARILALGPDIDIELLRESLASALRRS